MPSRHQHGHAQSAQHSLGGPGPAILGGGVDVDEFGGERQFGGRDPGGLRDAVALCQHFARQQRPAGVQARQLFHNRLELAPGIGLGREEAVCRGGQPVGGFSCRPCDLRGAHPEGGELVLGFGGLLPQSAHQRRIPFVGAVPGRHLRLEGFELRLQSGQFALLGGQLVAQRAVALLAFVREVLPVGHLVVQPHPVGVDLIQTLLQERQPMLTHERPHRRTQQRARACGGFFSAAVCFPRRRDRPEDLLLRVGAGRGLIRLVELSEVLHQPFGFGVGVGSIEHVRPDEQVEVTDVLHGLRLAHQRQGCRRLADSHTSPQRLLVGALHIETLHGRVGRPVPTDVESVLRPSVQAEQVEMPVMQLVPRPQ